MTATQAPEYTFKIRPSKYFQPNHPPKLTLGQLIKTCIDQYSGCVDVLCVRALTIDDDGDWRYGCSYVARIKKGGNGNSPVFDQGDNFWLDEQDLDHLTKDEEGELTPDVTQSEINEDDDEVSPAELTLMAEIAEQVLRGSQGLT